MNLKEKSRENVAGYLFILPNLLGFSFFILFPLLFSMILVFTDWNYLQGVKGLVFVGLDNIVRLIHDENVFLSLKHNVVFSVITVSASIAIGLALAAILNNYVYLKTWIRTLIFLPYMSSLVAISVVWRVLFNSSEGPINALLRAVGISNPPGWLASPDYALIAIMIMTIWTYVGYAMILYMAGLQGISRELYEAASIDGATPFNQFTAITIQMLKPTTFLIAITLINSSLQVFAAVQVMTNGGPLQSTMVMSLYIYSQAFELNQMSYSATVSWLLFSVIFLVTLVQWRTQKKWQDQY
ncbi:sugar ABC transporter permease [Paenibacillus chondroitinus]|uniref:Sugar ABC transporter permease n=1 Tax=Paenibacillus chondroitinus TaxID=59842 RepID=A0ABU6D9P0_9BACL|nr:MULTISPECIES: sugar ABC transporter permease [Paenibacillus]MCY9656809.1 sugar ABC transporter permease [Paenibacillus anseongense]MEB4794459.1 sugar ABC transporter permease [Paenibacillus chondroitinus]